MAQAKSAAEAISVEDYLTGENDGTWRHEFVNGLIYAMAGASERHNVIKLNIAGHLNMIVPDRCRVFDGDMKLRIQHDEEDRFFYPDVFVSCDANRGEQYFRVDAILVIEVLSTSTRRLDRYEKLEAYKRLPSLLEYVLVEQDYPQIEAFRRSNAWRREVLDKDEDLDLASLGHKLTFDQIYRRVDFSAPSNP